MVKKYLLPSLIVAAVAVVGALFFMRSKTPVSNLKTYSNQGVSFQYPSDRYGVQLVPVNTANGTESDIIIQDEKESGLIQLSKVTDWSAVPQPGTAAALKAAQNRLEYPQEHRFVGKQGLWSAAIFYQVGDEDNAARLKEISKTITVKE